MDDHPAEADEQRPENWPIGRLLGVASRSVERSWAQALEQRGLTHAGLIVLHFLDAGITSQTELARLARVEAQTMSRTIDRLEREGLVARSPYPGDRRRHVLSITAAGREAFAGAKNLERDVFPAVSDPEALRTALVQIVAALGDRS
ncbi:MarR family transcriptional regulator [Leifsonia sp. PS1209]|uniref:MarR family winged helix-turn-helix transcriptional regulator n=1 Tax=Leifsonia sp. PS1209 TaxID=2724914 RepID=UPI001442A425|nr:MarR family transcriptional regulator [Leifsonia sp. PS1209]QIZ99993.1 MarR family transcriptional regulator [Leifsonia sp. PS1209]